MSTQKKKTMSLARTPVRRALDRAKGSSLLLLLAAGFIAGIIYNVYFK